MIAVLDSGSGNLRSVEKALVRAGGQPVVTSDPEVVARADKLVVPGQGAFRDCMANLTARGLVAPLRAAIAAGRPYLGLCLGLQILFDESEEDGPVAGLGLLPGRVVRFQPTPEARKVPHMGWNQVHTHGRADPLLTGIADRAYFYFVHSYHVVPADPGVVALWCDYGVTFAAAVRHGNLFACQFHPEKSQAAGLALLANFVESS